MKQFIWRLDYLCIEVISINIQRYSRIPREFWKLRYCNDFGERLIFTCLANSFEDGVDEKSYEFILNNFSIRKLKIFPKLHEKIEYFDFLNGKKFDELEIFLSKEIKLTSKQNFRLMTKELNIKEIGEGNIFTQSQNFFSNLHVEKDLKINFFTGNSKNNFKLETLLLLMLKNTSKEIENIQIHLEEPSLNFLKGLLEISKERKYVQNFNATLKPLQEISSMPVIFLWETILTSTFYFKPIYSKSYKKFLEYLQEWTAIESLNATCYDFEITDTNLKNYFSIINSLNLNNLKELKFEFLDYKNISKEIRYFFEACQNLVCLKLKKGFNFQLILPCSKTLKSLYLDVSAKDNRININDFKKFLYQSSLEEINVKFDSLENQYFFEIVQPLEILKNTLTSLSIYCLHTSENTLKFLPSVIEKFHHLKYFFFSPSVRDKTFQEILKSLKSSKALEEIYMYKVNNGRNIDNISPLFNLLNNCEKLRVIHIGMTIIVDKIPELLLILKKFQNILEEINLDLCCNKKYFEELKVFLSGCSRLRRVFVYPLMGDQISQKEFIDSFYCSRYSLQVLQPFYRDILDHFPHILMDKQHEK